MNAARRDVVIGQEKRKGHHHLTAPQLAGRGQQGRKKKGML